MDTKTTHAASKGDVLPEISHVTVTELDDLGRPLSFMEGLTFEQRALRTLLSFERKRLAMQRLELEMERERLALHREHVTTVRNDQSALLKTVLELLPTVVPLIVAQLTPVPEVPDIPCDPKEALANAVHVANAYLAEIDREDRAKAAQREAETRAPLG